MKYFISNLMVLLLFNSMSLRAQDLSAMTYNIRYSILDDPRDHWNTRKDKIVETLRYYKPDVFGVQEAMIHQLRFIEEGLSDFDYIGVGREDGKEKGEHNAIFYNTSKLELTSHGTFWLSETGKVGSKGWNAGYIRICTYARFKEKATGQQFWLFNTHLDHKGTEARINSTKLLEQKIKQLNKEAEPFILMGDLNDVPKSPAIEQLNSFMQDGYMISETLAYGPKGTFNGFKNDRLIDRRIDYIFVNQFSVSSFSHIDDRNDDNSFASDHLPVLAKLRFKRQK